MKSAKKGQSRNERKAEVVANVLKNQAKAAEAGEQVSEKEIEKTEIAETTETAGAENPATPDAEPAKKKRKASETVRMWRAQKAFPLTHKITIIKPASEKPKRRAALTRYEWYKNGMSVADYIAECKKHDSPAGLAMADMRWDHVSGFIKVEG